MYQAYHAMSLLQLKHNAFRSWEFSQALEAVHPLRHPFWEFEWSQVWHPEVAVCSVILFLSGVLCSAAGIGGGGIYVVVLMLLGQLSTHEAVPLSKAIVFYGAIASLMVNMKRLWSKEACQDPRSVSVVNFNACRLVVPNALLGTFLGVLYNHTAKAHTIVILLTCVLWFMTLMVCRTAWKQYSKETAEALAVSHSYGSTGGSGGPDSAGAGGGAPAGNSAAAAQEASAESKAFERGALRQTDVVLACVMMIVVVLSGIVRFHMGACRAEKQGSGRAGSCKHPIVWSLFGGRMEFWMDDDATSSMLMRAVMSIPLWSCVLIAMYYGTFVHNVANWSKVDVLGYQAVALATGLLAGLVGVGGGLVFSPFFLLMGMEPSVAVATSSTCVLFTSSSTTIQYLFTDRIMMSLSCVYGLVTLTASYVGTSLVHTIEDHFHGRRSYITCVVAVGVALSAVLSLDKFVKLVNGGDVS